ncbi:MAG: hypothetical protein GWM98_07860, partial [Nitrospinaceae bacterium]|nr:hypothetical protein [Nitrospinaceae bacterium]NIR54430.1 hypothetical protein [Nitrospinaceae bacterium]NIS84849.1 hypothetical protein [Nitrospinaceae bacterium]NIT81652.1 hypothetical protein [Nitrospinaceae bacterium]NIU43932.1 hypothetical protein [Nitrospinaceae bacterium]
LSEEEGEELESAAADADEEFFQKENLQEDQSLDDLLDSVEKNLDESPPEQKTSPSGEAEPDANTSALIDEMLQDVRCLKEETEAEIQKISGKLRKSSRDSGELADVDPASVEDDGQLEKTFQQLRRGKPGPSGEARRKGPGALAAMNEIVPEPEDLLGHLIHPEWASEEKRVIEPRKVSESRPDLIGESLNYLSDLSSRLKEKEARAAHDDEDLKEFADHLNLDSEKFSRWVEGRIRQVVGESLEAVLAKEVAGVSDRISRSIRQAVRETAPGIIRKIIQEEIEKIKRMEEV